MINRRAQWLKGKYANVDGIPFQMPVETLDSPALFSLFSIDPVKAQEMMPGQELYVCPIWKRALLMVAVVNYQDTSIGKYVEFCIGIVCCKRRRKPARLLPLALPFAYNTGVYIYDLPVSTEISVKGGLGIWGMPKRQGNLDFIVKDGLRSSQYDLDGQMVARIDVPDGKPFMPFWFSGVGYGSYRGLLTLSRFSGRGKAGLKSGKKGGRLILGDHPRADCLKALDINPTPIMTGHVPHFAGVLDDHIDSWYLTSDTPPDIATDTMHDVIDLTTSEAWLTPPNRDLSDTMIASLSPDQWVGRAARPASNRDA